VEQQAGRRAGNSEPVIIARPFSTSSGSAVRDMKSSNSARPRLGRADSA